MDHHFTHEDIPMCVLIGHNGAGKKTLLSSITSESDIPPQVKNGLGYIPFEVINTYPEGEIDERKTICNMMVVPCHMMYVPQMSTRLSKAQLAIMVISPSVDNENDRKLSRHYCFHLASLRIQKLFVAVNFKDCEDAQCSEQRYDEVKEWMSKFVRTAGYNEEAVKFFSICASSKESCKTISEAVVDRMSCAVENPEQPRVEIIPDRSAKKDKVYHFAKNLAFADFHLDTELNRNNWIDRLHVIYQTPFESDERLITNGFEAASKKLIEAGCESASKAHALLEDGKPECAEVLEIIGFGCRASGDLTGAKSYFQQGKEAIHHSAWGTKPATLSDRLDAVLKDLSNQEKQIKRRKSKMKVKKSEDKMGSERKVDKNEKDDNETVKTKEHDNKKEEEQPNKEGSLRRKQSIKKKRH